MASSSNTTKNHDEIRRWAEERGGKPAHVANTGSKEDIGLLRLEFPGATASNDANLEEISWEQFFEKFDERGLALLYQDETAGGQKSNFNKLVSSETADESEGRSSSAKRSSRFRAKKSSVVSAGGTRKAAKKFSGAFTKKAAVKSKTAPSKRSGAGRPAKKTSKKAGRPATKKATKRATGSSPTKKAASKKVASKKAGRRTATKKSASRKRR